VVNDAEPLARRVKPLLRETGSFVGDLRSGLRSLRRAGPAIETAAEAVPPLLRATTALADGTLPLVRGLRAADTPGVIAAAGSVLDSLLAGDRLVRVIDATDATLAQIQAEDLIGTTARAARSTPRLMRRLLRVQQETLRVQRRSFGVQRTTLDYVRRATAAAESLDRKTGGQLPPVAAESP
jgi:hypothetical protein